MQAETKTGRSGVSEIEASRPLRLGPFNVSTARAEVDAFRRETGWPDGQELADQELAAQDRGAAYFSDALVEPARDPRCHRGEIGSGRRHSHS